MSIADRILAVVREQFPVDAEILNRDGLLDGIHRFILLTLFMYI